MKLGKWFIRRKAKSAGTKLPAFLPILEEMARAWEAITEEDIERANLHLAPLIEGETKLGVLHSQEVRRTWASAEQMAIRCKEAQMYVVSRAQGEDEVKFYKEQAMRFDTLEDCFRQLFWAQAKDDIGGPAWVDGMTIGVRTGWMFVKSKRKGLPDFIEMFGGGLRPGRD